MISYFSQQYMTVMDMNRPIKNVAFYDRASTKPQETNNMRQVYCDGALEIAERYSWNIIKSKDSRNGGVCFLDGGTGSRYDNRPQYQHILNLTEVDTIAAVGFDRLARSKDVADALASLAGLCGKNLIILQTDLEADFHNELKLIFSIFFNK